jgi:glutamyl-tRNA reductase
VPRNVEAASAGLEGVFLYAVDDLQELVERNLGKRRAHVPAVEKIVQEETDRFQSWLATLDVTPVVVALREQAEAVRRESVERFGRSMSETEREQLERFSRTLTNKLMHAPTVSIRSCDASTAEGQSRLAWVRKLYGIDGKAPGGGRDC